jgi:hypothetical protein
VRNQYLPSTTFVGKTLEEKGRYIYPLVQSSGNVLINCLLFEVFLLFDH